MNQKKIKQLEKLNIFIDEKKQLTFDNYEKFFLKKNSVLNLISKNDEKFLFEKHIYDSLAINKILNPKKDETLLDIGTGGGFPSIPAAIIFENLKIYPVDSIRKKITAIEEIRDVLQLKNVFPIAERVENIDKKFDYITTRAVSTLDKILPIAIARLKKGGLFIAYKSKKTDEELKNAEKLIKKFGLKPPEIIKYELPTEEHFERNLIVFTK